MLRFFLPIGLFAVAGVIVGFVLPHTNERTGSTIMSLLFSSLMLGWIIADAKRRQVTLGSFLPVVVLLLCPVGVLWYGIRSQRWSFWKPFGYFILLMLVFLAAAFVVGLLVHQTSVASPPHYQSR